VIPEEDASTAAMVVMDPIVSRRVPASRPVTSLDISPGHSRRDRGVPRIWHVTGAVVLVLLTMVGVWLGVAWAGPLDRRFGPENWRRSMAQAPVWLLPAGVAVALHTVNVRDLAPQAILSFAGASLLSTVIDSLRALRRQRVDAAR